ncbi:MAG: hypothetical protein APR63_03940 [Desulfuromonas sp. SDB]|nr:MAG: hypothetical protein APR63_03940 [Desulfuromonas sp. SDB]
MTGFFLNRPKALFSLYAIIAVLGITSLIRLPIELYPEVSYPGLTISVNWSGASPELVEKTITRKIESEIFKLQGIRNVQSRSTRGSSEISVEFEPSVDIEYQKVLISEAISRIEFPQDVRSPHIEEQSPEEFEKTYPLIISLSGPYDLNKMTEIGERIKIALERTEGVKQVLLSGTPENILNVEITDPTVNPYQVAQAFYQRDQAVSHIDIDGRNLSIVLKNPVYPEPMYIGDRLLSDVARINLITEEPMWISRINGNPALTFRIEKRRDQGLLEFSEHVRSCLTLLDLDDQVELEIIRDEADDIRDNMKKLGIVALIAITGVSLTFLVTMKSRYSVVIFFLTILFSSLITVIIMYFTKLSLNVLTLSGIALGFGLVVDNSIIVMENILRLKEDQVPQPEKKAAGEVFLPVVASTLTTISIFIPFLFFQGETRAYYIPFALAASYTLISSIIVSFTLTPVLAKKLKPVISYHPRSYQWLLKHILTFRWVVIPLTALIIGAGIYLFQAKVEKGSIISYWDDNTLFMRISLPAGSEKGELVRMLDIFEHEISQHTGYISYMSRAYDRMAFIEIDYDRDIPQAYLLRERLQELATNFANCRIVIVGFGDPFWTGSGFSGFPQFTIKGYDYYKLVNVCQRVKGKLESHPRIVNVDINFSWWGQQKEFQITPKPAMILYGFSPYYVASMLRQKISFNLVTEYETYTLNVFRDSLLKKDQMNSLPVGRGVELSDLCNIQEYITPGVIERENQQYTKAIAYDFQGPYKMAENFRIAFRNSLELPQGFSVGDYMFHEPEPELSKKEIIIALVLAVFLLMVILSSLYESLTKPLLIILVLPFAFVGVALIYFIFDQLFDASAFVGLILLLGIAVNDGIVLVDHLSRGKHQNLENVVTRAGHRFRPILLTTFTTLIGLLPFAFMESEVLVFSKLSISCLGGLIFSTLGSLLILPVFYYTFFSKKNTPHPQ